MLICVSCVRLRKLPGHMNTDTFSGARSNYLDSASQYFPSYEEQFDKLVQLFRTSATSLEE